MDGYKIAKEKWERIREAICNGMDMWTSRANLKKEDYLLSYNIKKCIITSIQLDEFSQSEHSV